MWTPPRSSVSRWTQPVVRPGAVAHPLSRGLALQQPNFALRLALHRFAESAFGAPAWIDAPLVAPRVERHVGSVKQELADVDADAARADDRDSLADAFFSRSTSV